MTTSPHPHPHPTSPPPDAFAGDFTVDLFSTGGGACASSPYAKCLSSFRVAAAGSSACRVTLTSLAPTCSFPRVSTPAGASYVAGNLLCPSDTLAAGVGDGAGLAEVLAAARALLDSYLWSEAVGDVPETSPPVDAGTFSYTASACTLQYASPRHRLAGADPAAMRR